MDLKSIIPWRNERKAQLPATREDLLDPFVAFRREVDHMFDGFFEGLEDPAVHPSQPYPV